jgi:hypothetical protein
MICRHCNSELKDLILNLGHAPPSNAFLTQDNLDDPEIFFPLRIYVCTKCWLVQTLDYANPGDLFTNQYVYFSSTSSSWLEHSKNYAEEICRRLELDKSSLVVEIASNDGYLLQFFNRLGIPNFGIEPTESTAKKADSLGVKTLRSFFSYEYSRSLVNQGMCADLIVCNNVFAHVPDINDFSKGLFELLKHQGVVTLEFPHLMELLSNNQFDTVYHEHFSYLSLTAVRNILRAYGLRIFDVEKLSTHGGSLRVFACRENAAHLLTPAVAQILKFEEEAGLTELSGYSQLQDHAIRTKHLFLEYLLTAKKINKRVVAYGAAAKGNTLLNFSGISADLLPAIFDAAEAKQNMFTPGGHIPVLPPESMIRFQPDEVVIFPWNISEEVMEYVIRILGYRPKFVILMPDFHIV